MEEDSEKSESGFDSKKYSFGPSSPDNIGGGIVKVKSTIISKTKLDGTTTNEDTLSGKKMTGSKSEEDFMTETFSSKEEKYYQTVPLEEFCRYIPLRLDGRERSLLTVLECALQVSEYTDNVDVTIRRGSKARRILEGILEVCNVSTGLAVGNQSDRDERYILRQSNSNTVAGSGNSEVNENVAFDKMGDDQRHNSEELTNHSSKLSSSGDGVVKKKSKNKSLKKKKKKKLSAVRPSSSADSSAMEISSTDANLDADAQQQAKSFSSPSSMALRSPQENAQFFRDLFEVGRRNRVLNPSKRSYTYGKLMHILQDAQSPNASRSLGFSLHKPMLMVYDFLSQKGEVAQSLLKDKRLLVATAHIPPKDPVTGLKSDRTELLKGVENRRLLKKTLVKEYAQRGSDVGLSEEDLWRVIESIADAYAVVAQNLAPVQRALRLLRTNFDQHHPVPPYSLQLTSSSSFSGGGSSSRFGLSAFSGLSSLSSSSSYSFNDHSGPTLNHSHSTQYVFVEQSLRLWCEVQANMHRLWACADADLLSTQTTYSLWNTGQGLQRVQSCPRVARVMRTLLGHAQNSTKHHWVGLSVVHLGDRDVPNALVFIDKYTQIPLFLKPLVDFVDAIPVLCSDDASGFGTYVQHVFRSPEDLQKTVLADYFKHGFDGSGDDGGSCIDGRLTSSWNWTSRVAKKSYYHALMLSGFQGFDGEFGR